MRAGVLRTGSKRKCPLTTKREPYAFALGNLRRHEPESDSYKLVASDGRRRTHGGRTDGRTDGRTAVLAPLATGRADARRTDGRTDGGARSARHRTGGRTDGRTDGRTADGRTDGRSVNGGHPQITQFTPKTEASHYGVGDKRVACSPHFCHDEFPEKVTLFGSVLGGEYFFEKHTCTFT